MTNKDYTSAISTLPQDEFGDMMKGMLDDILINSPEIAIQDETWNEVRNLYRNK